MKQQPTRATLRRQILQAATAEFALRGFPAARLNAIARAAGVDYATLSRLAGGKLDLYAAVVLDLLAETLARVSPAVAVARSPEGRLRAAVSGIADAASENRHFAPLLLREIASGGAYLPGPAVAHVQLLLNSFSENLSRGAAGGVFRPVDPLTVQIALAGSLLVVLAAGPVAARLQRERSPGFPADLKDAVSQLLLDGVRQGPPSRSRSHADRGANRERSVE